MWRLDVPPRGPRPALRSQIATTGEFSPRAQVRKELQSLVLRTPDAERGKRRLQEVLPRFPFEVAAKRRAIAEELFAIRKDRYALRVLHCHPTLGRCRCPFCSLCTDELAIEHSETLEGEWSKAEHPVPIVISVPCDLGELDRTRHELTSVLRWLRDTATRSWLFSFIGDLVGAFECPIVIERGRPRILLHLHAVIDATGSAHEVAKRIEHVLQRTIAERSAQNALLRPKDVSVHAEPLHTTVRNLARYVVKVGRAKSTRPEQYSLAVQRAREDEERGIEVSAAKRWLLENPGVYERARSEALAVWYARSVVLIVRAPSPKKGAQS